MPLAVLALGCASLPVADEQANLESKKISVPPGKALVYVVRSADVRGRDNAHPFATMMDRKPAGNLYGGTYQMVVVEPGPHKLACILRASSLDIHEFHAEPGGLYFFELSWEFWTMDLEVPTSIAPITEAEGRQFVAEHSLAPPPETSH